MDRKLFDDMFNEDIFKSPEFRWIETSGSVKHYFEKISGDFIKVPNYCLPAIFSTDIMKNVALIENEDYDYLRFIKASGEDVRKCIFGFPNPDVLNAYIEERNSDFDELIKKAKNNVFDDIDSNLKIIDFFIEHRLEAFCYEVTEHEMNVLTQTIDTVSRFINERPGFSSIERENLSDKIEEAMIAANSYTILKPYKITENIITERDIYTDIDSVNAVL